MARLSKDKVIEELTNMGVDFDVRESYDNLWDLLKIERRNRESGAAEQPPEQERPSESQPLSSAERNRLKELEQMARMGRAMDQPTPAEMHELGRLRARADVTVIDE